MAKTKKYYVCSSCGNIAQKWLGRCPECDSWNSFVEETDSPAVSKTSTGSPNTKPVKLSEFSLLEKDSRIPTGVEEIDRVLGGGFVESSLVLLGGEPGVGKSTLMLQLARKLSQNHSVMYVTGEESVKQLKIRALRLDAHNADILVYGENNLNNILFHCRNHNPEVIIVDSIQTVFDPELTKSRGSINQIKETASKFLDYSKLSGAIVIIVGHITKSGDIAGPKILEHLVDVVLYFEGDRHNYYRIIRAVKNRFGSVNEIGIFEMTGKGLVQVKNPSRFFMGNKRDDNIGSVLSTIIEGNRAFVIEIQALVTQSNYPSPQRVTRGYDSKKLALLIAVMEKHLDFVLGGQDIFINIVGGLKIDDPSIDLAIAAALISSYKNIPIQNDSVFFGELGLGGEVRDVDKTDIRISEIQRLKLTDVFMPETKTNFTNIDKNKVKQIKNLHDLLQLII